MWTYAISVWPKIVFTKAPKMEVCNDLVLEVRKLVFGSADDLHACDLRKICVAGGFHLRQTKFRSGTSEHDALLVPKKDGTFVILVDPNRRGRPIGRETARHRARFRVAHEIGHSFFYDRTWCPAKRISPLSPEEEEFCDNFAFSLLIPHAVSLSYPCEPASIFDIQDKYDVSVKASARALSRVFPEVTIVGTQWKTNKKTGRKVHRVIWWTGPRFVPIGAVLGSLTVDRLNNEKACRGTDKLQVGELSGTFDVQAERRSFDIQCIAIMRPL